MSLDLVGRGWGVAAEPMTFAEYDRSHRGWCCLCNWRAQGYSVENIEFLIARHLRDKHGKDELTRWVVGGRVTEVP